jgi:hypothetical protein
MLETAYHPPSLLQEDTFPRPLFVKVYTDDEVVHELITKTRDKIIQALQREISNKLCEMVSDKAVDGNRARPATLKVLVPPRRRSLLQEDKEDPEYK